MAGVCVNYCYLRMLGPSGGIVAQVLDDEECGVWWRVPEYQALILAMVLRLRRRLRLRLSASHVGC